MAETPHIYQDVSYRFRKLIITDIWKIPDNPDYAIELSALTPEYTEIFKQANFRVGIPGLLKMMKNAEDESRQKFWKLFYEISESGNKNWRIGFRRMIKVLGAYPAIEDCMVMACVMDFQRNDQNRIENIAFKVGDPETQIFLNPENSKDSMNDLSGISRNILTLAQKKGYKLNYIPEMVINSQNKKEGDNYSIDDNLKNRVSKILESLHRWGHPQAIKYSVELQKAVFVS